LRLRAKSRVSPAGLPSSNLDAARREMAAWDAKLPGRFIGRHAAPREKKAGKSCNHRLANRLTVDAGPA
jgi:hypothetical protein